MKPHYSLLWLLLLPAACAAEPISVKQFSKITSAEEREKAIEQAPPEQQDTLVKIDHHLMLLAYDRGKRIQGSKESAVAKARGFRSLEDLFLGWANDSLFDAGHILDEARKSGMTHEKQLEIETRLDKRISALAVRQRRIHEMVFQLAASPQAMKLEKRAEKLLADIDERTRLNTTGSPAPTITKQERATWEQQMNGIFEEMKRLPTLTSSQLRKEYDEFPEAKIYQPG